MPTKSPKDKVAHLAALWLQRMAAHQNPQAVPHFKQWIVTFKHPSKGSYVWTERGGLTPAVHNKEPMIWDSRASAERAIRDTILDHIVKYKYPFDEFISGWDMAGKTAAPTRWTVYLFSDEGETLFEKTFPARDKTDAEKKALALVKPLVHRFDNAEDWVVEPAR